MTPEDKEWIDNATLTELLTRWRRAPANDPIFAGDTGNYYSTVMFGKRDALPYGEWTKLSKSIGWD